MRLFKGKLKMKPRSYISFISALIIFISIALCSCEEMFQVKINMDFESETVTLSDLLKTDATITKLPAPKQIFASEGQYNSSIEITWKEVEEATTYRLERAVIKPDSNGNYALPEEGDFSVIVLNGYNTSSLAETSFTDVILDEPDYSNEEYRYRYYYRVCASNTFKEYEDSDFISTKDSSSDKFGYLFAPPSNVKASQGADEKKIRISWEKVHGAQKYHIYRTFNKDGTGTAKIGSVTSNQNWYDNTIDNASYQGIDFYYTVYAENDVKELSCESNTAQGYTLVSGAPKQVENVAVVPGQGRGNSATQISISWDASSAGANPVHYAISRNSSQDASLIVINQDYTGTTYVDKKSLKPGIYYYYYVQAWCYDSDGTTKLKASISDSGSESKAPAEGYILSAPSTMFASKDSSNVTISFLPSIGSEAERLLYTYKIYGDTDQNGTFANEITEVEGSTARNEQGYYTVTIPRGSYSFYKIKTLNSEGIESAYSSVFAPAPLPATNVKASKNDFSLIAEYSCNKNEVYPVRITWNAPADDSVTGYAVYRANSLDGNFKKITETALPKGTTEYIDINATAKAGIVYYYKVLTLNVLNQGTQYSEPDWGYGAITSNQFMREYNKTIMSSQSKLTLMHKSGNTAKLGIETINGNLSGTLYYNASIAGVSGRVVMLYTDYSDFYIHADGTKNSTPPAGTLADPVIGNKNGCFYFVNGNTNTSAGTDTNGQMDGTVTCTGMYPGTVNYDNIQIKSGNAGGGYYIITRYDFNGNKMEDGQIVNWTVGEE